MIPNADKRDYMDGTMAEGSYERVFGGKGGVAWRGKDGGCGRGEGWTKDGGWN